MPDSPRLFIYDFDGTLVDSALTSYECYAEVFGALGVDFDRTRFAETYCPDWYQTYRALGLGEDRWAQADRLWMECYARRDAPLFPGARAALETVRARGLRQALVTSGSQDRVRRELTRLDIARLLDPVVCCEDVEQKKPHPEGLVRVLEELGVPPSEAVYLGDSPEDVQMARAAQVRAVAIPGGFPNHEALEASAWDLLAGSLEEAVSRCLDGRG
jgi:HAD superfamily hydrolase (TIGR01509 family)